MRPWVLLVVWLILLLAVWAGTPVLSAPGSSFSPLNSRLSPETRELLSPDQLQWLEDLLEFQRARPEVFPSSLCWSPDTDPRVVEAFNGALFGPAGEQFNDRGRWFETATDGAGLGQGEPTTLTWGMLPDGVNVPDIDGDRPSNLIETLDNLYGRGPGGSDLTLRPWFPLVEQGLQAWAAVSGVRYVYEPHDDSAPFPYSAGILGVRPDIRLSGRYIDGPGPGYNIFAYNYFPPNGDMVIDVANTGWLGDPENNSRRLRNLITHENGHGLGLAHTCPYDGTTIMDPRVQIGFDGPQHDDIRGVSDLYGDVNEFPVENDSVAVATDLGFLADADTLRLANLSIDDTVDRDVLAFTVAERMRMTFNLAPVGTVYYEDVPTDGGCLLGYLFNSRARNDLGMRLLGVSGTNVLTSANARPSGLPETIESFLLEEGAGTYFVNVFGDTNEVQLYDLEIIVSAGSAPLALCKDISSCSPTVNRDRFNDGSYDPDGDPITLTVTPEGPYPPGETTVEVVVSDGALSDTCQATVTVNRPPAAAARDVTVAVSGGSCQGTVAADSVDAGSVDPDGDDLSLALDPPGPYPEGSTSVRLIVTDRCGVSDTATATVTVDCTVPVELLSFTAVREGAVTVVGWEVASAWDHAGFHVFREAGMPGEWGEPGPERVRLTERLLSGSTRYRFEDVGSPGVGVRYWLQEVSRSGEVTWHGPVAVAGSVVRVLSLLPARPNPFTGSTVLRYAVPGPEWVELAVYDPRGRRVKTLVEGSPGAGEYEVIWRGDTDGGGRVAAGLYFVRLRSGKTARLQKLVFMP